MSTSSASKDEVVKKETDITVYGATSFVAKHVIRYLMQASEYQDKLTVTLGGRNKEKLEAVKSKLTAENPEMAKEVGLDICLASGSDLPALKALATRSRVVLNCAGPYSAYSSLVVAACADVGTDYVDITGEVAWVAEMRQKYGPLAKESGARIISLCGYDSIPSDMALFAAVESLRNRVGDGKVDLEIGQVWHEMFGLANGGTIHTAVDMPIDLKKDFFSEIDETGAKLRRVPHFMGDPLLLAHPRERHNPDNLKTKHRLAYEEWMNELPWPDVNFSWGVSLPHPMAAINIKVMQASAVALGYGKEFTVRERYMPLGFWLSRMVGVMTIVPCLIIQFFTLAIVALVKIPKLGKWLVSVLAPPGSGCPDRLCAMGSNSAYATVSTKLDEDTSTVDRGYAYIKFQGEAGNYVTSQCVSEAALALVYNRDALPKISEDGFGTPAELLGMPLIKRFQKCKVRPVKVHMYARTQTPKNEMKIYIE